MISCEIKVKHNFKNINAVIQKLPQTISNSVEEIIKNIRGYAIKLEKRTQQGRNISRNDWYVNQRSERKSLCWSF